MEKSPAFQFYPVDFLHGVRHFTAEEVGAYIMLLCEQWDRGFIKKEEKFLKKITGISSKKLQNILEKFKETEPGIFKNSRLEKERKKQENWRAQRVEAGKKSAEKRKKESEDFNDRSTTVPISLEREGNSLSSSLSLSSEDNKLSKEGDEPQLPPPIPDDKEKKKKYFKIFNPPDLKEVEDYIIEQTEHAWTAEKAKKEAMVFVNHYTGNGWRVGRNKMKDWQASLRNWVLRGESRHNDYPQKTTHSQSKSFQTNFSEI